jgi:chorismate lyase/3-hydroxybenzoate synthase
MNPQTPCPIPTDLLPLRIEFGPDGGAVFAPGVPVLAGDPSERLFPGAHPSGRLGALALYRAGEWLIGAATVPLADGLEAASHRLYSDILHATRGLHLARIWNYVPAINDAGPAGLENYRIFCRARSLAFEQNHGSDFKTLLPSASAVGTKSTGLTVVFAATPGRPRHVENPLQVSAYDYPGEYGPRAPSFARATVVPGVHGAIFISGTAAIRGHATIGPDDLQAQLACTLENLREISTACGLGPDLGRDHGSLRHFKVYLRHASDQPDVAVVLQEKLLGSADRVSYLHADICRTELLVEIEATLFGVKA